MYDTTEDQITPSIRQLSVFLPNRMGALMMLVRQLEREDIHILAVSILDSADHSVVRLVVDRPTLAVDTLVAEGYRLFDAELLAVCLPGQSLRRLLATLLMAELNVDYVYPIVGRSESGPVLALHVQELEAAAHALKDHGFKLLDQDTLG